MTSYSHQRLLPMGRMPESDRYATGNFQSGDGAEPQPLLPV